MERGAGNPEAIEAFAHRHMHVRDRLAWKAARGEALSEVERATLHALEAALDDLEPPPAPLSTEVRDLLREGSPIRGE